MVRTEDGAQDIVRGTAIDSELLDDGPQTQLWWSRWRLVPKALLYTACNVDVNVNVILNESVNAVVGVQVNVTICVNVHEMYIYMLL